MYQSVILLPLLLVLEIHRFEHIEGRHAKGSDGISSVNAGRYQVSVHGSCLFLGAQADSHNGKEESQKNDSFHFRCKNNKEMGYEWQLIELFNFYNRMNNIMNRWLKIWLIACLSVCFSVHNLSAQESWIEIV